MPPGPNGNMNETLSLRKRFGAMWMPWIREYFACLAGLPLFPVGSSWFVFVLGFFKSSHNLILYIVNLGCAPVSLSLPSDSIVWPVWLFFRSTWTRVVLCLFLTSRMSARHCYTQSQCGFILDGDTLWYIACLQRLWGSAEARSSTKACPQSRPMNIEMECFHYSASNFTKLEAAPMEQ